MQFSKEYYWMTNPETLTFIGHLTKSEQDIYKETGNLPEHIRSRLDELREKEQA
jgi:hypothetical protein